MTRLLDRSRVPLVPGSQLGILWLRANGEWNGVALPVLKFNVEVERRAMLRIECRRAQHLDLKEPVGLAPTLEHVRQRSAVPFKVVACVGLRGVIRVGGSLR
jgi:hypothetical protein